MLGIRKKITPSSPNGQKVVAAHPLPNPQRTRSLNLSPQTKNHLCLPLRLLPSVLDYQETRTRPRQSRRATRHSHLPQELQADRVLDQARIQDFVGAFFKSFGSQVHRAAGFPQLVQGDA